MEYIYLTGTDNNESSRNVKNAMTWSLLDVSYWLLYFYNDFNFFFSNVSIIGFLDFSTIYYDFIRFL